jgi:hypothetical protein
MEAVTGGGTASLRWQTSNAKQATVHRQTGETPVLHPGCLPQDGAAPEDMEVAMTMPPHIGDRVRITGVMDDPDPIPVGTEGTVDWVNTLD